MLGADDPLGDGILQGPGSADGHHPLPHLHFIRIPEVEMGQSLLGRNLDHRQVCFGITAHQFGGVLVAIGQENTEVGSPPRPHGNW